MKVLVACEYSGRVRDAFIKRGHTAMSCDLLPTDSPGPHYQGNVLDIINDGWDLMIAHPPCTYLAVSGMHWTKRGLRDPKLTEDALEFVHKLMNAPIQRIALENPISVISSRIRKPDQIIQPWGFGENASKKTCLWLKNLPPLSYTKIVSPMGWDRVMFSSECDPNGDGWCNVKDIDPCICDCIGPTEDAVTYKEIDGVLFGSREILPPKPVWGNQTISGQNKLPPSKDRWKLRSTTYQGIADAMAAQWG